MAWMIGDQCARQQPPRNVVIVMAFSTWWTPSDRWTRQGLAAIPRPLSSLEAFEPALPLSPLHRIEFFADRYVRLYSSNVTIATALRGMIYQRLAGRPFQTWTPPGQTAATSLGEQVASGSEAIDPADRAAGYIPLNPLPPTQQQALIDSAYGQIMEHEPVAAPENREALRVIGELADQHGFDVWLANGPLVREFYELPRAAAWFTALDQDLARLSATHDRLHHLPGYLLVERAEAMDMGHLLPVGARRYTGWLADAMIGAGAVAVEP